MMAAGALEQPQEQQQPQQQLQLYQPNDDSAWEATDQFKMYQFKVALCRKPFNHDWTACPYSHIGERACRRDPMRYNYASVTCLDMLQKGKCARGDACGAAHSLFEYWLHPDRYRTEMCKVGPGCTRRICFFAHNEQERRPLPAHLAAADAQEGGKYSLSAAVPRGTGSDGSPTRLAGPTASGSPRRVALGSSAPLGASPLSSSGCGGITQQQAAGLAVQVLSAPQEPLRAASSSCSSMGVGSSSSSTSTNSPLHSNSSWQQWNVEAHSGGLQVLHASSGLCGPLQQQQQQQQFAPQQVVQLLPRLPSLASMLPGGQLGAAATAGGGPCPLVPTPTATDLQQQQQQQWLMARQMQQQQYSGVPVCAGLAMHLRQLSVGDACGAGSLALPAAVMQQPQLAQMMPGQAADGSCGPGVLQPTPGLFAQQQWMLQGQPGMPPPVFYAGSDHTGQQLARPPMLHPAAPGVPAVTSWL